MLRPCSGARVLEVGIGANVEYLIGPGVEEGVCLEPDAELAARFRRRGLPECCRLGNGTIERTSAEDRFDTILYIDVLEHIEDDSGELRKAARNPLMAAPSATQMSAPSSVWRTGRKGWQALRVSR
jgi:hypothetical protein